VLPLSSADERRPLSVRREDLFDTLPKGATDVGARSGLGILEQLCEVTLARSGIGGTIARVSTQQAVAALTFDDGPHPESTPRLLEILATHHARATFFMIGEAAEKHRGLVRRVAEEGHAIGNHSWDHPSFPLVSGRERRQQIRACERALAPYGLRLFRPPYGHQNLASWLDARRLRYDVVTWSVVAEDWRNRDAISMTNQLVPSLHPGCVVTFHDGLFDASDVRCFDRGPMLKAVAMLLDLLHDRFRFVTIPELLRQGRAERQSWFHRPDARLLNGLKRSVGDARRYTPDGRSRRAAWPGAHPR
jgi:peptidoglycan-N-acetylglucosamine deacetylase